MSDEKALIKVHPEGEPETGEIEPPATPLSLDTPVRTVKVGLAQGSAQMRFDLLANLGSEFWPTLKGRYYAVARHLRPAFDLEHPHRVGFLQRGIYDGIVRR